MINDILTAIAARLAATEPNLKHIDEDWGQLDYYDKAPPVKFPCALFNIKTINWVNQSQKVQDGVFEISIKVASFKLSNSSSNAPSGQKANDNDIWIILENIHKALQGWRPDDYPSIGSLTRLNLKGVNRDDGIKQFEVVYNCMVTDNSAQLRYYNIADPVVADEKFDTVPPDLDFSTSIKKG